MWLQLLPFHSIIIHSNKIRSSFRWFSKCAMFQPNKDAKVEEVETRNLLFQNLMFKRFVLKSSIDLYVLFHHSSFSNVHREISIIFNFDGKKELRWISSCYESLFSAKHIINVSVSKKKDLNTELTPCFDGTDYSAAEFEKLGKDLKDHFSCTSPFLPKIYRAGAKLCKNDTVGKKVQNFIKATGLFATNMWKNDYFFLPPCTYSTYSYHQTNLFSG